MTNYQIYSQQILQNYDERYEDLARYVKEAKLNDKLFSEWLQFTLENIVHAFSIIEVPETMCYLKEKYEHLLEDHLKTILEMD